MSEWLEIRRPRPSYYPPKPWAMTGRCAPERGLLAGALYRRRLDILFRYPLVPLWVMPWKPARPAPVGELLLIWDRWDYIQGSCPACQFPAVGTSFGGMVGIGSVTGVCTGCGFEVTRWIDGAGYISRALREHWPEGSACLGRLVRFESWSLLSASQGLLAILQELGERKLPNSASVEFS